MNSLDHAHGILHGKRLFVVGAGYVGGALVKQALAAGAHVTALTRNPEQAGRLRSAGARVVQASLQDHDWHAAVPRSFDWVVNCVSSGWGGVDQYRASYVRGLESLLRWQASSGSAEAGPCALIYTSSTSVYPQDGGVRVTESAPVVAIDERSAILLEAEQLATQWSGPSTILRLAGIYGPARHHLLTALQAGESILSGLGDHHLNLVHRDDIVAAILAACVVQSDQSSRIFNVADDGGATKSEVVAWLAQRLGRAMPTFSGENAPGRRARMPDRVIANDAIKAGLGWRPTYPSFREGYAAILGA